MEFYGIYTPIITPFNDDFSVDEAAYAGMIEKLIADGVHGIIIAGTTGEYYAQSTEERIRLMALGIDIINNRLPVIVGSWRKPGHRCHTGPVQWGRRMICLRRMVGHGSTRMRIGRDGH